MDKRSSKNVEDYPSSAKVLPDVMNAELIEKVKIELKRIGEEYPHLKDLITIILEDPNDLNNLQGITRSLNRVKELNGESDLCSKNKIYRMISFLRFLMIFRLIIKPCLQKIVKTAKENNPALAKLARSILEDTKLPSQRKLESNNSLQAISDIWETEYGKNHLLAYLVEMVRVSIQENDFLDVEMVRVSIQENDFLDNDVANKRGPLKNGTIQEKDMLHISKEERSTATDFFKAIKEAIHREKSDLVEKGSVKSHLLSVEKGMPIKADHIRPIIKKMERLAEEGYQLDPEDTKCMYDWALYMVKDQKLQESIFMEVAKQSQVADKTLCAKSLVNLGNIQGANGHYKESLAYYEQAEEKDPTHPFVQYNKAVTLSLMGNVEEAMDTLRVLADVLKINNDSQMIVEIAEHLGRDKTLNNVLSVPKYKEEIGQTFSSLIPKTSKWSERMQRAVNKIILYATLFLLLFTGYCYIQYKSDSFYREPRKADVNIAYISGPSAGRF